MDKGYFSFGESLIGGRYLSIGLEFYPLGKLLFSGDCSNRGSIFFLGLVTLVLMFSFGYILSEYSDLYTIK